MSGSSHRRIRNPLGLWGSKMAKNGQKWSKMAKNDLIRLLHRKTPPIPKSGGISD